MTQTTYDHVQKGFFHWLLYGLALLNGSLALLLVESHEDGAIVTRVILGVMTVVFVLLAVCFQHLRVSEGRDALEVAFGPFAIIKRRVPYRDIVSARRGRSRWIDGWGIHWAPDKGWIWNIRGRDCVELTLSNGRLRVGTNDPDGLIAHLEERIGERASA